jgi:hypothetical protein
MGTPRRASMIYKSMSDPITAAGSRVASRIVCVDTVLVDAPGVTVGA